MARERIHPRDLLEFRRRVMAQLSDGRGRTEGQLRQSLCNVKQIQPLCDDLLGNLQLVNGAFDVETFRVDPDSQRIYLS